jgi:hypothetical protein
MITDVFLDQKTVYVRKYVSVKLPCEPFIRISLHFFGEIFLFYFLIFCVIRTSLLSFPYGC